MENNVGVIGLIRGIFNINQISLNIDKYLDIIPYFHSENFPLNTPLKFQFFIIYYIKTLIPIQLNFTTREILF